MSGTSYCLWCLGYATCPYRSYLSISLSTERRTEAFVLDISSIPSLLPIINVWKAKGGTNNWSVKQINSDDLKISNKWYSKSADWSFIVSYKVGKLSKRTTFSKCFYQSCDVLFRVRPSKSKYHRLARVGKEAHYLAITKFKLALNFISYKITGRTC